MKRSPVNSKESHTIPDSLPRVDLRVVRVAISELKLDPENPRVHTKRQIRGIAQSIRAFGFNQPVLIDENFRIIAGHGRVAAAKLLGLNDAPAICIPHLSKSQRRALSIADNRLAEQATWDKKLLGEQLSLLCEVELNFDLEVTGFEMKEIALLMKGLSPAREDAPASVDANELASVSKPGDVWQAARHRLYCGDASEERSFSCLMEGKKSHLVIVDPPYQLQIENVAGDSSRVSDDTMNSSGGSNETRAVEFLRQLCRLLALYSVMGSFHYLFLHWRYIQDLLVVTRSVYSELLDLCVWTKRSNQVGGFYDTRYDLIFVFRNGNASGGRDFRSRPGADRRTNVWNYPGQTKPVSLVSDLIHDCTTAGQLILDPFLGSGTTLIAAEKTGRVCHGMEICPRKMDAALRRWQKLTGCEVIHSASKRKFNDIRRESSYVN